MSHVFYTLRIITELFRMKEKLNSLGKTTAEQVKKNNFRN